VPKQTGIGARLWFMQYDLSGDTGAIDTIGESRAMLDVTGIDKEYMERLPGLGDGVIGFTAYFNPTNAHAALSPIGTAARIATAAFATTVGAPSASISAAQESYNITRGQDGSLVTQTQLLSHAGYGVEWGNLLTAGTVSAVGTGTAYDGGTATANGASGYLHVLSVTSGTATVTIEGSASGTASWSTLMTFTAAAAGTAERQSAAGSIPQFTRYNTAGGTAVIAVALHRN
jgi:hypothetical protein